MFMGGCILAPGYFAEDFVALAIATHPSPYTLLPLRDSLQNAIVSASTCLTWPSPEVNNKASGFPTAVLLGIGAGKADNGGTEEQL